MAEAESNHSLVFKSCEHTHFDYLLRSATLLYFITMEYITSNKRGRKLAFENNIYIKQKVLSNGAVWGDIMGGFCPGEFCPRGDSVQGISSGGFCPGGFCPRTVCMSASSKFNEINQNSPVIYYTVYHRASCEIVIEL